jgi:protein TonB
MPYRLVAQLLISVLAATAMAQSNGKTKPPESCETPENPGHGITPPRLISAPGPNYPLMASENARAQRVALEVVVSSKGRACGPQVKQSPGPEFERAALAAIRDWKWKPATKSGTPIAVRITVEMSFQTSK